MSQERILVVDDDPAVRGIVGILLERSGYRPTLAAGAVEALENMQANPPYDLVLSDVMMPGTDGFSLLDSVCRDHPGTPVVLLTAVQDAQMVSSAFRHGAFDYLLKPFQRVQLEAIVNRALEHGRLCKQAIGRPAK